METTTKKIGNEYKTGLLWRRDDFDLPEIKRVAERRSKHNERNLERDEKLKKAIQITELISKGYIVGTNIPRMFCESTSLESTLFCCY